MSITLKLRCGSEVQRVLLQEESVTYQNVQEAIQALHRDTAAVAKYLDDENDLCTLCPASFSDFLASATTVNGRRILKLEITSAGGSIRQTTQACPMTSVLEGLFNGNVSREQNSLADIIRNGLEHLKGFVERGGFEGLEQLAENGGIFGCPGGRWHDGDGAHFKQVQMVLLQLHKNGLLHKRAVAALAVHSLSEVLTHTASHADKLDWIVRAQMEYLRPVLQDLRELVANIPELENCAAGIDSMLTAQGASPSETVLALLTSLDTMSFDGQIAFFEAAYASQEGRLEEFFRKVEPWTNWMPTIPLDHVGVVCDGCNCPIKGLRFRCKTCPDYDLCGECYTTRTQMHTDENTKHEFELKLWPDSTVPCVRMASKGGCWGKGVSKRKGFGKGKAKFCGKRRFYEDERQDQSETLRKCAREGSSFVATGHSSCCRAACVDDCAPADVVRQAAEHALGTVTAENADFQFPVVVEDGRRLTLEWNRGDESSMVAERFATNHSIPAEELPVIVNFIEHATALHASITEQRLKEQPVEPTKDQPHSNDREELNQVIKRLEEMGLGTAEMLEEFVQDSGGDVQKVVAMLTDNK